MKTIITITLTVALAVTTISCHTTYDAYGNPRQVVDPATAIAGVAAAGVLGYALASDNDNRHHRSHHRRRHYDSHNYRRHHQPYYAPRYSRYSRYH